MKRSRRAIQVAIVLTIWVSSTSVASAQSDVRRTILSSPAARSLVEAQQQEGRAVKCGFPALLIGMREAGWTGQTRVSLARPAFLDSTYTSPGGNFLLHYTLTGVHTVDPSDDDADSVPDYIEAAAATLDSVRAGYIGLGWRTPMEDENDVDGLYDVYFHDLATTFGVPYFGFTEPTTPWTISAPWTAASFMHLENDYLPESLFGHPPLESLRVTVAHEYHHAVQLAYNLAYQGSELEDYLWFAELSAVYHEEVFYDGINDYYTYLNSYLGGPQVSLTDINGLHMYGAALWALFLAEVEGADANRSIWTRMADLVETPLEAQQAYLDQQGGGVLERWREFSIWQLFTGSRAQPGFYFEEAASYPEVRTIPGEVSTVIGQLPSFAFRYYEMEPDSTTTGGLALQLRPSSGLAWGAGTAGAGTGAAWQGLATALASSVEGRVAAGVELLDWNSYDSVVHWTFSGLVDPSDPGAEVSHEVETIQSTRLTSQAIGTEGFRLLQNYPNPFRPGRTSSTYFAFSLREMGEVTLEVRSLGGRLLWRQRLTGQPAGINYTADHGVGWDGRDGDGSAVPSGVYLIVGHGAGSTQVVKMTVIR